MKLYKIILLCIAALILAATPVVIAEVHQNAPITIKTELNEGEILSEVKLSDGVLYFVKYSEIAEGLTGEDREEARLAALELVDPEKISIMRSVVGKDDELRRAMNIFPETWNICGKTEVKPYSTVLETLNLVVWREQGKIGVRNMQGSGTVFTYRFYKKEEEFSPYIVVKAGAADAGLLNNRSELGSGTINAVRTVYGHRSSVIGGVPLAVSYRVLQEPYGERVVHMYAEFAVGETRYTAESAGFTQKEFIEFLISVCGAPVKESKNIAAYILENYPEINTEAEKIISQK